MPQIKRPALALVMLCSLLVLSLSGCGDDNSHSTYEPERGEHPEGWLPTGHAAASWGRLDTCTPCHGAGFQGGISLVACTQCHLGNQTDVHPLAWGHLDYARHAGYVRDNGTGQCATTLCHGAQLQGGTGPSCSVCHLGGTLSVHPANWRRQFTTAPGIVPTILPDHGDYVIENGAAACITSVCHGPGTAAVTTGIGSTRFTGTTGAITTLPGHAAGGPGTVPGTGAMQTIVPTGRACSACHTGGSVDLTTFGITW